MDNIIFKDNTEFEIKEGASESEIIAIMTDFTALGTLADALTVPGNLDNVQFKTVDTVTGEYTHMKLNDPLFRSVYIKEGKVLATFSIRKKTEMELAIEELQTGQAVQDGAIGDLGTVVSEIAEGGIV